MTSAIRRDTASKRGHPLNKRKYASARNWCWRVAALHCPHRFYYGSRQPCCLLRTSDDNLKHKKGCGCRCTYTYCPRRKELT